MDIYIYILKGIIENEKNILNKFKALSNIRCSVFPDESFDVILLDPPCSALGTNN